MHHRTLALLALAATLLSLTACGIERRQDRREDRREDRQDLAPKLTLRPVQVLILA